MVLSFEELMNALAMALINKFGTDSYQSPLYCLVSTFPDYVIARGPNAELYRIEYTVGGPDADGDNDAIMLGEPQQVDVAYVPVSQAGIFLASEAGQANVDDWSYPVQVMKAGWAAGSIAGQKDIPHYFPPSVVAEVAEALSGAKFGRRHPPEGSAGADEPERIAGWMTDGKMVAEAANGVVHLLKSETDLQAKLSAARAAGKLDLFGVSALGYFAFKAGKMEGKDALVAQKLGKLISIDLCAEAGAGGKFLHYAASKAISSEISQLQKSSLVRASENSGSATGAGLFKGAAMKDRIKKLLEALRAHDAGRATALTTEFEALRDEQHGEFLVKVTEAAVSVAAEKTAAANSATGTQAAQQLVTEAKAALDETKRIQSKNLIETKLAASKLPIPAMNLVREHLKDQIVDEARVDGEIKLVRESFAAYSNIGRVGHSRISSGLDSRDKVQLSLDQMLGVTEAGQQAYAKHTGKPVLAAQAGIPAFRGIKEAYVMITGDSDLSFGKNGFGGFTRVSEAVATTDFPSLLLDSMNKRLIQDYTEFGMAGLDQLITEGPPLTDYRTQNRVREGYMSDFPTVAEAGPYTELTKPTDEKITYTPSKRGGLLTISEETIRADDLGKIKQFPQRLARAGRHTLKTFISNFFINNPNYVPDSVAWFNAGHNNLVATALSVDALIAAEVVQMKQTEKDSGNRLGLRISWIMVPVDLAALAWQINNSEEYNPGPGLKVSNPFYLRFGPAGTGKNSPPGIIVNELLTDTNDWYYGVSSSDVPILEIAYMDGISNPQIYLADLQTQGTQFTNDQIQYKAKFPFGGAILDFRGAGKSVVP